MRSYWYHSVTLFRVLAKQHLFNTHFITIGIQLMTITNDNRNCYTINYNYIHDLLSIQHK